MRCPTLAELPPPPAGKTGWPWTEETPLAPPALPDGSPWPRVTIVTPSFNQGQFIEETIRSVLLQGYPNLEHIVIDGGSTDGSAEIIRKYEPWLAYWISEPDKGQADAINSGFARATGDVLGWLNSDDIYEPGALKVVAREFFDHPECDLVYGTGWQIDEHSHRTHPCGWIGPLNPKIQVNWNQILQPAAFWRRRLWERAGALDLSYYWGLDWEWFIRATKVGTARFIPVDLAAWRITPHIKSVSGDRARRAELAAISRRHGGPWQPTYVMYRLDGLIEWMTEHLGLSLPARLLRYPTLLLRANLSRRLAGRYVV